MADWKCAPRHPAPQPAFLTMNYTHPNHKLDTTGYTLVEVMVAATISLLVGAAGLTILVSGIRSSLRTASVTAYDISQWNLDSRLWVDSKIANGISLYEDFTNGHVEPWLRKSVEGRGNFLVLSLSEIAPNGVNVFYKKLSGYHYDPDKKAIYRFEYIVSKEEQDEFALMEDILKNNRTTIQNSYVIQTANATALSAEGLFICRAAGKAASLACLVSSGKESSRTLESKLIEATFIIRN